MFHRRYAILEMESIPRDKAILQAQIVDSRRRLQQSRLMRFAALIIIIIACGIIATWIPDRRPAVHLTYTSTHSYLPVVIYE